MEARRGGRRYASGVRLALVAAFVVAALVAAFAVPNAGAQLAAGPRVTFIGDSVPAGLLYAPDARRTLTRGLNMRLDLEVCRRLVAPSCSYRGTTPSTALQVVQSAGSGLGRIVVVKVGYNDSASQYRSGLDAVMRALRKAGVDTVVWATLGETRETYRLINGVIRKATSRWPELVIADWAAVSRGKPWFSGDGLHLEPDGAMALARLIRGKVLAAA